MTTQKLRTLVQVMANRRRLSDNWEVSDDLWKSICKLPTRLDARHPEKELVNLFRLAKRPKQRALLGSLMFEQGLRLPLHLESHYIRALMQVGRVNEAIQLWKSRNRIENSAKWNQLGIYCFCYALRLPKAEQLAKAVSSPSLNMCGWFVVGYSRIPESPRLEYWTSLLIERLKPKTKQVWMPVLDALVRFHCWPQVSLIVGRLEFLRETLPRRMVNRLMLSFQSSPLQLAMALSRDPNIVNTSVFPRVLARSAPRSELACTPNEHVASLLCEGQVESAKKLTRTSLRRYQLILRYASRTRNVKLMDWVASHAPIWQLRQGRIVQILIQYLFSRRRYSTLLRFMNHLITHPKLLDSQSLVLVWRLVYVLLRNHRKLETDPFFPDIRRLLEVTVKECPVLERGIAVWVMKALTASHNFLALASVLRYLEEACGLPVARFDAILAATQYRYGHYRETPRSHDEALLWSDVARRAAHRSGYALKTSHDYELYRELNSRLFIE